MATANTKRKSDAGVLNDLYITPEESLDLFFGKVSIGVNKTVLEPCDGTGVISNYLKDQLNLRQVVTNEPYKDIYKTNQDFSEDFLTTDKFTNKFDYVVMNPPFKQSAEFVEKAVECADKVFMFGRLTFLESRKRYDKIFSNGWLDKVFVHTGRVGCPKGVLNEDGTIAFEKAELAVPYAWYMFSKYRPKSVPATVFWI